MAQLLTLNLVTPTQLYYTTLSSLCTVSSYKTSPSCCFTLPVVFGFNAFFPTLTAGAEVVHMYLHTFHVSIGL